MVKAPSPQQRERLKRALARARAEATVAKARGIEWYVKIGEIEIDASVLAYCSKPAAKEWIASAIRSGARLSGWDDKTQQSVRRKLWGFWKGD